MKTPWRGTGKDFGRKMGWAEISRLKAFIFLPFHLSAISEGKPGRRPMAAVCRQPLRDKKGRECRGQGGFYGQSEPIRARVGQQFRNFYKYIEANHLQIKRVKPVKVSQSQSRLFSTRSL
jgi:hypothetical protein